MYMYCLLSSSMLLRDWVGVSLHKLFAVIDVPAAIYPSDDPDTNNRIHTLSRSTVNCQLSGNLLSYRSVLTVSVTHPEFNLYWLFCFMEFRKSSAGWFILLCCHMQASAQELKTISLKNEQQSYALKTYFISQVKDDRLHQDRTR